MFVECPLCWLCLSVCVCVFVLLLVLRLCLRCVSEVCVCMLDVALFAVVVLCVVVPFFVWFCYSLRCVIEVCVCLCVSI